MMEPMDQLDDDALEVFVRKGLEAGVGAPQVGEGNAVKVRRVLQATSDLAGPLDGLRILDLGCGEGVYAIEAGMRGAEVLAVDVRTERMSEGAAIAERHGLEKVRFRQADARELRSEHEGTFDVVWCLGLLYHLDAPELFDLVSSMRALATRLVVIDTLISTDPDDEVVHEGRAYAGSRVREHEDDDPEEVRRSRLLRSIDSIFAFHLARDSLVRALDDAGFSSVLECRAPLEPGKADDRITLAALCGERAALATYPQVNGLSEDEIAERLGGV